MGTLRFHGRRLAGCSALLLMPLIVYYMIASFSLQDITDRVLLRTMIARRIQQSYQSRSPSHLACQHPVLDVHSEEMSKFFHEVDPLVCDPEPDWVIVKGSQAIITNKAKADHGGDVECSFTELIRKDDDTNKRGLTTTTHDKLTLANTDFFDVSCTGKDGATWRNTIAGIRENAIEQDSMGWEQLPPDGLKLNVLILGFDSLSHNTFIRTLPKTYRYLTEKLGGQVMSGYNIVGDGTPQALIPILTGKSELELPETRKRMGNKAHFVDIYPFIWQKFKKSGYVTLFAEDQPHIGTFNYRLRGFDAAPTDHYLRPFFVNTYPDYHNHPNYCLRGTPRHKVFLNYVMNFMEEYRDEPKFAFAFHAELSHDDYNLINVADNDLLKMLTQLQNTGHLHNTLLMIMSDHGHRFTAIRGSQQGKQEERLPFFSIVLPRDFIRKYPSATGNVRENTNRLTTPFDVYPTLQDVLHFSGARLGQVTDRGISFFSQVPPSRTCADAYIEPHWCACLSWDPLPTDDDRVEEASSSLVHYINTYTAPQRSVCQALTLNKITWAAILLPSKGMMSFKQNADVDGYVPDLTDTTNVSEEVYEVHVTTKPNNGHYEASLTYNIKQATYTVRIDDISRTNRYGNEPHCIMNSHPQLRKFCYCVQPPPLEHLDNPPLP